MGKREASPLSKCSSPVERELLKALGRAGWETWFPDEQVFRNYEFPHADLAVHKKLLIGGLSYELDFLLSDVVHESVPSFAIGLAIEVDGHAFHEKTKEQAARDRSRDRALVGAGLRPFRFTGAEVYANPGACVAEVHSVFGGLLAHRQSTLEAIRAEDVERIKTGAKTSTIEDLATALAPSTRQVRP